MASYSYTFTSGDTVTPTKLNNARTVSDIVNADIKSDAAIAGTKIAPDFGSQNIVTTGTLSANSAAISGSITLPSGSGVRAASITNGSIDISGGTAFNTTGASIALRGSTATFNGHGLEIYAGGSERMRIDSSGNVGIGTATVESGFKLHVAGNAFIAGTSGTTTKTVIDTADQRLVLGSYFESGVGQHAFIASTDNAETGNSPLLFQTGTTERMRIDSSGNLLVNSTTAWTPSAQSNSLYLTRPDASSLFIRRGDEGNVAGFYHGTNTQVGSISITSTATAFNESSDYRLKQNIEPMAGGLAKLMQLQPRTYEFIVEPDIRVDGFIAHEVQEVVPRAVTGEKDGEDMQGLDMSKLVPVLVAAVQELSAKVDALEAAQ